jgi:Iap family predicted aminopeptidase
MNKYYINKFINEYCKQEDVDRKILFSKCRDRDLVERRMILGFFLRNRMKLTWSEIGRIMNRTHASIIHYEKNIEDLIGVYPHLQRKFKSTMELFKSYKGLIESETDIYSQLLLDNNMLKEKIEQNEKLIKQLINLEEND